MRLNLCLTFLILSLKLADRYDIISNAFEGWLFKRFILVFRCFTLVMLDFVLRFSVNETNNYVLMENVVKEHGFSTPDNYNLIRCAKINNFCFILFFS